MTGRPLFVALVLVCGSCGRVEFDARADAASDIVPTTDAALDAAFVIDCGGQLELQMTDGLGALPEWGSLYGAGAGNAFVAGGYEITPDIAQGSFVYWGLAESLMTDHRASRTFIEVGVLDPSTTGQTLVRYGIPSQDWVQIYATAGKLFTQVRVAGTPIETSRSYDPVAHRWWQLAEDGGTLTMSASPDGITWTTLTSAPTPAYVASSQLELSAGYYETQSMPLGTARFDHLWVCSGM